MLLIKTDHGTIPYSASGSLQGPSNDEISAEEYKNFRVATHRLRRYCTYGMYHASLPTGFVESVELRKERAETGREFRKCVIIQFLGRR